MSFATNITTLLKSSSTLNSLVSNQIYSHKLPINKLVNNSAIVYSYSIEEKITVLGDVIGIIYSLYISIISDSIGSLETISDTLISLLDDYSDNNIRDIEFLEDFNDVDNDKGVYIKDIKYKITYDIL